MKLKHFKVEKFDKDKIDHYVLVKKIERGSKVDYISPHLMNYLEKAQTKNYVLKDKEGNSLGLFGEKDQVERCVNYGVSWEKKIEVKVLVVVFWERLLVT